MLPKMGLLTQATVADIPEVNGQLARKNTEVLLRLEEPIIS